MAKYNTCICISVINGLSFFIFYNLAPFLLTNSGNFPKVQYVTKAEVEHKCLHRAVVETGSHKIGFDSDIIYIIVMYTCYSKCISKHIKYNKYI